MGISRRASLLALGLALSMLSGCWLQPGYGPERQSFNPFETSLTEANVGSLHQVWSVPTDFPGQPLVTPGAVVNGASSGSGTVTVRALARPSGALLWQRSFSDFPLGSGNMQSVLSVGDGEVLTVRVNGIEELDLATGATTAAVSVPGELLEPTTAATGSGVIAHRALHLSSGSSWALVVRRRDTLEQLWTAPIESVSAGSRGPIVIVGDRIYVDDSGGPTGSVIRAFSVDGCGAATCEPVATLPVPPHTGLATANGRLLAATDAGDLIVAREWQDDRGVVFGTDLLALASDGTVAWEWPLSIVDGVAIAHDAVFAVGSDAATPSGQTTLFARSDSSSWRADAVGFERTPVVAGGLVYVERAGEVAAYDTDGCGAPSCDEVVAIDAGPGAGGISGMSVTAGTLYVNQAGPGGVLTAFTP